MCTNIFICSYCKCSSRYSYFDWKILFFKLKSVKHAIPKVTYTYTIYTYTPKVVIITILSALTHKLTERYLYNLTTVLIIIGQQCEHNGWSVYYKAQQPWCFSVPLNLYHFNICGPRIFTTSEIHGGLDIEVNHIICDSIGKYTRKRTSGTFKTFMILVIYPQADHVAPWLYCFIEDYFMNRLGSMCDGFRCFLVFGWRLCNSRPFWDASSALLTPSWLNCIESQL